MHWEQEKQITYYSGYRPFIGSGEEIATWNFALRLLERDEDDSDKSLRRRLEGAREIRSLSFGSEELVRRVRTEFEALRRTDGRDSADGDNIARLGGHGSRVRR